MNKKSSKHPSALPYLFLTEMWERFGYYLMLGIFSLYMLDSVENGGMGFSPEKKSDIYGTYLGLVYLTPFIGGLLADRMLGYRKSIVMGGLLMSAGYYGLAMPGEGSFYISLLLIILGNGFFKPNISTLLGNLYNKEEYRDNKDAGYNIFYMGINIGAFICNFVAAYLRINYGWGWAFAAAGTGMLIGLVIFLIGTKHVKSADVIKPLEEGDMSTGRILMFTLIPMFAFGILGYLIPGNILGSDSNDAFILGCVPVVSFFIYLYTSARKEDKRPIGALLAVYGCLVVFWAIFHQNGDALTTWAEQYTDRAPGAVVKKPFEKLNLLQTVQNDSIAQLSAADFAKHKKAVKVQDSILKAQNKNTERIALANTLKSQTASRNYFSNMEPSEIPAKGQNLKLISTEIFQSINPFWVVLLTPIIVGFWGLLRRRKKEPTTAAKIAIGLLITGLSALVMVAAVRSTDIEHHKVSSFWLIASYGVITIGELCLSPMGLSLVSKLSPTRITALMMGGFFLSTAVGNKLSGMMSSMWESFDDKGNFFYMNCILAIAAAGLLFALLKWLNAVMKEKNIR
ncbi:MAG: peptide MFS transporter [Bacteroidota bacterium]|jgi:POT family proton-dependent oligopeptide transporter